MENNPVKSGSVCWRSPSNIALVKYWGKYGRQYPKNPSISFTLSHAYTETKIDWEYIDEPQEEIALYFRFESKEKPAFAEKIRKYLKSISDIFPLISNLKLSIDSHNSFPHSSGIASSASSMSALAMCLLDIDRQINSEENIDLQKASVLARLGSGSASRSVFPKLAIWGQHNSIQDTSQDYAIPYHESIDDLFLNFHDDILIISDKEKSVSSRAGHALMDNNPYGQTRFDQAHNHLTAIIDAMQKGDIASFGAIVEKEALTLHALMMASDPPYLLIEPNTVEAIKIIQSYRQEKNIPVYFTLDAGPNIHLLYPHHYVEEVKVLKSKLRPLCANGLIIDDRVGNGPTKIN